MIQIILFFPVLDPGHTLDLMCNKPADACSQIMIHSTDSPGVLKSLQILNYALTKALFISDSTGKVALHQKVGIVLVINPQD